MPEFQNDPYGLQDFHDGQIDHYRKKAGYKRNDSFVQSEQPSFVLGEGTGMPIPGRTNVPARKPVGSADVAPAAPRGRSAVPGPSAHKPVGSTNGPSAPQARLPTPGPSVPPKDYPRGRPATPGPGESRTQSPAPVSRPSSLLSQDGKQIRVMHQDQDGRYYPNNISYENFRPQDGFTPPASPSFVSRRPESRAPQPISRRESAASNSSWRSRTESISKSVRRFSGALVDKMRIVGMDETERSKWKQDKQFDQEEYQQFAHEDAFSKSLPKPAPSQLVLSTGEKMAIGVSKGLDGFKRQRGNTNDSDMIGGMTDEAPEGTMVPCGECQEPTKGYLKNGLCPRCARYANRRGKNKDTEFVDPWQFPQGRSTWPETGSPEHGYMKLPRQKKIMRIRNTIYEDPGNPFADEVENESLAPDSGTAEKTSLLSSPQAAENPSSQSRTFYRSLSVAAPTSYPAFKFDEEKPLRISGFRGIEDPPPRSRNIRRSVSVAAPTSVLLDKSDEYVPPRKFWRTESMPLTQAAQDAEPSRRSGRDTKWYGFYDDILTHYKNRESTI